MSMYPHKLRTAPKVGLDLLESGDSTRLPPRRLLMAILNPTPASSGSLAFHFWCSSGILYQSDFVTVEGEINLIKIELRERVADAVWGSQ